MVKFCFVEEIGFIKGVDGMMAVVSLPKKSACEGCSLGVCKADEKYMEVRALNPLNASVGQKVRVVMKSYTYLKGSLIVYGIPALALIAGAVLGKEVFSPLLSESDPDIVSAITGFAAFIFSFVGIKVWSSRAEKRTEMKPVIEEILDETG